MTDIIDRLRNRDAVVLSGLFHAIPAMAEAADEIERLRAALLMAADHMDRCEYPCDIFAYELRQILNQQIKESP